MKAGTVTQIKKKKLIKQLELKIPPPVQALICMGLMKIIALGDTQFILSKRLYVFLYISSLGGLFALWAVFDCYRNKTTIHPQNPQKTNCLITLGAFRFSRNPMYLGLYVSLLGWGIYLGNFGAILFSTGFPFAITVLQILPEERILAKKFGSRYRKYTEEVRRWI